MTVEIAGHVRLPIHVKTELPKGRVGLGWVSKIQLVGSGHVVPDVLPSEQPFWDRRSILVDLAQVKSSLSTPSLLASFLTASFPHSGDWLYAMPISSSSLRPDDEAVRVGVGLRLGLSLCVRPHKCYCGSTVDVQWLYSFGCKKALGRPARHHTLNDLVARGYGLCWHSSHQRTTWS